MGSTKERIVAMNIKTRILVLSLCGTLAMAIGVLGLVYVKKSGCRDSLVREMRKQATEQTRIVANDIYRMLEIQDDLVQLKLKSDLNVARSILQQTGSINLDDEMVQWNAVNQYTSESTVIQLAKMRVGDQWLGQNASSTSPSPLVDEVQDLVGGTCTIFQRMNESGDMLRVCTNVVGTTGARAIGTFIPHVNPDGKANPVIASVLKGESFCGRAFVVDAWYSTVYEPIVDSDGAIVGVLYVGRKQEEILNVRQAIADTVIGKTGYVYVVGGTADQRGTYLISKDGQRDGECIWDSQDAGGEFYIQNVVNHAIAAKPGTSVIECYEWKNDGELAPRKKIASCIYFAPWDWVIGASVYESDFDDSVAVVDRSLQSLLVWGMGGALILMLLIGGVAIRTTNSTIRPIAVMTDSIRDIVNGEGDLTKRIPIQRRDEIGLMADWFNRFIDQLQGIISEMAGNACRVAAASNQLSDTAVKLTEGAKSTTTQSSSVSNATGQMNKQMVSMASSAQQMSTNVRDVAAAIEQMTNSIAEIAKNAEQASSVAGNATDIAQSSKTNIGNLGSAANEIGDVIKVIQDIAEQTNLLALNATIEAARAGEAGQGFAVVANEVKQLAKQTAEATDDIRKRIESIQGTAGRAVSDIDQIASVVAQVNDVSIMIASAVEEQSISTKDISRSISETSQSVQVVSDGVTQTATASKQIASSIEQVDSAARETSIGAEETRASGEGLANLASGLQKLVDRFRV